MCCDIGVCSHCAEQHKVHIQREREAAKAIAPDRDHHINTRQHGVVGGLNSSQVFGKYDYNQVHSCSVQDTGISKTAAIG